MNAKYRGIGTAVCVAAVCRFGRRLAAMVVAVFGIGLAGLGAVDHCAGADPAGKVPSGTEVVLAGEEPASAAATSRPASGPIDSTQIYKQLLRSTVLIYGLVGDGVVPLGTGWVADKDKRLIVTNDHVVDETKALFIFFPAYENGKLITDQDDFMRTTKPIKGTLIGSDAKCDLALIRLERMPPEAVALKLAPRSAEPGEVVHSVGNPSASQTVWVYTTGTVRQVFRLNRWAPSKHGPNFDARVMSTQSPVNPGDSGGPVVNGRMELVAVVSRGLVGAALMQFFIDVEEVREYLRSTLPLVEPKSARDFNNRGLSHYYQERYDEAVRDFSEALKLAPEMTLAMANRGDAFRKKNDYDTALADYNAAIRGGADQYWVYKGRGLAHYHKGNFDAAIADFTEAVRRKPDHAPAYNFRAWAYSDLKRPAEAIADYTRAIKLQPSAGFYFNRGKERTKLKQYEEAVADFSAALRMEPNDPQDLAWRAWSFYKLRQYGDALRDYNAAIEQDRRNARYHNERGDVFYEVGKYREALEDYVRAVMLSPKSALYYFNCGLTLRRLGADDEARGAFAKAVQLDPQYRSRVEPYLKTPTRNKKPTRR